MAVLFAGALIWLAFFLQLGKIREMSDNIQKEQLDSLVRQERSQKILEMGKELGDVEKSKNDMSAMLVDKEQCGSVSQDVGKYCCMQPAMRSK